MSTRPISAQLVGRPMNEAHKALRKIRELLQFTRGQFREGRGDARGTVEEVRFDLGDDAVGRALDAIVSAELAIIELASDRKAARR